MQDLKSLDWKARGTYKLFSILSESIMVQEEIIKSYA
jgi:hypothetical protein